MSMKDIKDTNLQFISTEKYLDVMKNFKKKYEDGFIKSLLGPSPLQDIDNFVNSNTTYNTKDEQMTYAAGNYTSYGMPDHVSHHEYRYPARSGQGPLPNELLTAIFDLAYDIMSYKSMDKKTKTEDIDKIKDEMFQNGYDKGYEDAMKDVEDDHDT